MTKIALASAALAAFGIAPAIAADLAISPYYTKAPLIAPVYSWTGFYAGLNAGGASSHNCWTLTGSNISGAFAAVSPAVSEGCHNATGGLAGGQLGYRWQASNWIFGVEAQGDWANLKGSNPGVPIALGTFVANQTKIDALGLFTGQIGYTWYNVLWYAKGGAAVTHDISNVIATAAIATSQASETRWGGAVGTGLEWGFAPGWSVGVEYDHLFLGRGVNSFTSLLPPVGIVTRSDSIKQDVDMGTVRVNYSFGGPAAARY